jgi:O-antigen/teichoic acid export membrane protein
MTDRPARRIAGAFLALGAGEIIGRLLAFVTTLVIARVLGADGYGVYALALAVGLYLAQASECGLAGVGVRRIAEGGDDVGALASAVSGMRLVLAVVLMGAAAVVARLWVPDPDRSVLLLSFLALIPVALDLRWVLIGLERSGPVGWARVLGEATTLVGVVWLVDDVDQLGTAMLCYVAGVAVSSTLLWLALRRRGVRATVTWRPGLALPLLKRGLPVAGQVLLGLMIFNADLLLLRLLRGPASTGLYAAAYAPLAFAVNVGYAFAYSVLPVLVAERAAEQVAPGEGSARNASARYTAVPDASGLWGTQIVRMLSIAFPLAAGGALMAAPIISVGFGPDYVEATPILAALMASAPFAAATALSWTALTTLGRERWLLGSTGLAAALNLVLNLLWIPRYGMLGAATATVLTEAFRAVLMGWIAWHGGLRFPTPTKLVRPLLATAAMSAFLLFVDWPAALEIAAGAGLYFVVLMSIGGMGFNPLARRAPR